VCEEPSVPETSAQVLCRKWDAIQEEEKNNKKLLVERAQENTMKDNQISAAATIQMDDPDKEKSRYLLNRLSDIHKHESEELRKQFALDDDDTPQHGGDIVSASLEGKYILRRSERLLRNSRLSVGVILR